MFCGEPVMTSFQHQVVFQSFINHHALVLEINGQGCSKGLGRTGALLSKPEGMFKTNEDG